MNGWLAYLLRKIYLVEKWRQEGRIDKDKICFENHHKQSIGLGYYLYVQIRELSGNEYLRCSR